MKKLMHALTTFALTTACAFADGGSSATVNVRSGPHAGTYQYRVNDACIIAALPGKSVGFSMFMLGDRSSLTVDIPNADAAHVSQAQIELVVAVGKPGQSRRDTESVTYTIDTRPDSSLENYQRAERKGMAGKATVELVQDANTAKLKFSGTDAAGVKIDGSIDCRTVDRAYGR